jgi:hypothetical protein
MTTLIALPVSFCLSVLLPPSLPAHPFSHNHTTSRTAAVVLFLNFSVIAGSIVAVVGLLLRHCQKASRKLDEVVVKEEQRLDEAWEDTSGVELQVSQSQEHSFIPRTN